MMSWGRVRRLWLLNVDGCVDGCGRVRRRWLLKDGRGRLRRQRLLEVDSPAHSPAQVGRVGSRWEAHGEDVLLRVKQQPRQPIEAATESAAHAP